MQNWISLQQAAAITQKPERTLRAHLVQGKIIGKKIGKKWQLSLKSLSDQGFCKIPIEALKNSQSTAEIETTSSRDDSAKQTKTVGHGRYTPWKFGLFKEAFDFCCRIENLSTQMQNSEVHLKSQQLLQKLVAGFFEYNGSIKAQMYREARTDLAHLWLSMEIQIHKSNDKNSNGVPYQDLSNLILEKLIPGLSGTLKKNREKTQAINQHANTL